LSKKLKIKISAELIKEKVAQIGKRLSRDYKGKNPVFVGILNGSFMFMADLMKEVSIDCEICFIQLKSYEGKYSTGTVELIKEFDNDLSNRHVIIVEDIVETGQTLKYILKKLERIPTKSVRIVSLLIKYMSKKFKFNIHYIGFEISQEFVVGYGLDYNKRFRNLDSIYSLE
tara:strand:- start:4255 stop:4770 length:516 start_codon:yes stop_codon:yes gene_type:complete